MADLIQVIGNKNYSSWSMRAWLALKAAGIRFSDFGIAYAMFAPIVGRFGTNGIELGKACSAYMRAVLERPSFREWKAVASPESAVFQFDVLSQPDRPLTW